MAIPNFAIVLGILLVAMGGVVATYGWNARTEVTQRNGMIRAIAAETLVNASVFRDPKFSETNEDKLKKFTLFPRMRTAALEGAIASGLFLGENDREFLTRAVNLAGLLDAFNRGLSFTEDTMSNRASEIPSFRKKLRDGKARKHLGARLQKFGELLMSDYGVKSGDTFFVKLED